MKHVQERPSTPTPQPDQPKEGVVRIPAHVPLWQLNLLRAGHLLDWPRGCAIWRHACSM